MNLKQILERLRNMKKHYYEEGQKPEPHCERSYGWACRAAGVDDAIQLIEREGPGPCYECACLRKKLEHASVCELSASNLNVKHWADEWERRALKAEAECEELRRTLSRVIHSDYVLTWIKPPSDPQLQEAQAYIQTLLSSRAAAVAQEQRTRAECNRLRAGFLSPEQAEKLADGVDDEWLDAIGGHYLKMFGQPWETRDGETASEGRQANVTALFQIIEDQKTEIERCHKQLTDGQP